VVLKKGIYLLYHKIDYENLNGIEKKIVAQINVFKKAGIKFNEVALKKTSRLKTGIRLLDSVFGSAWNYDLNFGDVDYIYFRRGATIDKKMRKMFCKIKTKNPSVKILMEIPTYPYDGEYTGLIGKIKLLVDRYNRNKLKNCMDRLIYIGDSKETEIWGIRAINMINGIEVDNVKPKKISKNGNEIHIICVAMFSPWHGYERLLFGLEEYYQNGGKRDVFVHMVGDGPELIKYTSIVNSEYIKNRVIFHGMLTGNELDSVYDICEIAVSSLGRYKSKLNVISDLKSREYLAKGIPMVTGCKIDGFIGKNIKYICEFPNDNTNISIEKIIDFYDDVYAESNKKDEIVASIRKFAKENIDISITMAPVLEYLQNSLKGCKNGSSSF